MNLFKHTECSCKEINAFKKKRVNRISHFCHIILNPQLLNEHKIENTLVMLIHICHLYNQRII